MTHLGPTLIACALVLGAFTAATARLTHGFQHWTFEPLRRQQAAAGTLRWPALAAVDAAGRPLQLAADGRGPVRLVDFIYTQCPSVCQALGAGFFQAQQQIRRQGSGVRLLSVSIDPARDTPAALAAHAARHRADPRLWTLAAPVGVDEGRRARQALGVVVIDDGQGGYSHNGAIHVVDRDGRVAGIFDSADWRRALALARTLERTGP